MTDEETTLTHMRSFDNTAPISANIIYDDSDEDNKDFLQLLSGDEEPESLEEQIAAEKNVSKVKRKSDTYDNKTDNIFPQEKRTCKEVDSENIKNKISSIQETAETDTVSNSNTNVPIVPESSTAYPSAEINSRNESSNTSEKLLNNAEVDKMKKEFQEVRNYIHNLLKNVSEHLILIVNAFQEHADLVNKSKSRSDSHLHIQELKARYTRFKSHIFQLSYSAVVSVILTQIDNNEFVKAFLDRTVQIARDKSKFLYTPQYIQPFFYEMLNWAKQKQDYMNSLPSIEIQKNKRINANNMPTLAQKLSQPPLPPFRLLNSSNNCNINEKSNSWNHNSDQSTALSSTASYQEHQSTTIFSSGPPGREVQVSIQPNLLDIQKQQMAQITKTQRRPPPSYSDCRLGDYYNYDQNNQQGNYHALNVNASNQNVLPAVNFNQYTNQAISIPSRQYADQVTSANTRDSQRLNMNQTCHPLPALREFRTYQNSITHQDYRGYEQQYTSGAASNPVNHIPENLLPYLNDVQNAQNTSTSPKKVVESGRSVSTDSGFASPLQFDTGGDKMSKEPVDNSLSPQLQPYITHVTSLNPNAVQIALGSCHVCRKPTKTKCMGCYKVYYCSYQCLNTDWNNHMHICKRSTET